MLETGDAIVEHELQAVFLHVALDQTRDFRIKRAEQLGTFLNQGHLEASMNEVLRRFQSDEAAAHDHSASHWFDHLDADVVAHAGEEIGALFQPLADRPGIRHGAHMKDAGKVDAGQRRVDGGGARCEHQLVVGLRGDCAGLGVAQIHGFVRRIDGDGLAVDPAVDAEHALEHLFRSNQ